MILARHKAGETLASIARTYDCSPPAISYIVSRSRERDADATPGPAPLANTANIADEVPTYDDAAPTPSNGRRVLRLSRPAAAPLEPPRAVPPPRADEPIRASEPPAGAVDPGHLAVDPLAQPRPTAARAKNGGTIDRALRERVDGDIAAFLAAFDGALSADTSESRAALREATDRLLRAGARTRIELERLEARLPLASRGGVERSSLRGWR